MSEIQGGNYWLQFYRDVPSHWSKQSFHSSRIAGQGARKEDPPEDVKKRWAEEKVPDGVDELNLFIQELKAQADCMESVDKRILRDDLQKKRVN